ncbi:MAG: Npt1/Npt2 family nucleotide transporter [Candidatus Babeliales bacterium]
MLKQITTMLWGNFTKSEKTKYGIASLLFFFIIGVYWAMRPLKDSIFMSMIGVQNIPLAKWISLVVVIPLVMLYSKLLDVFPRHKMFYALSIIYGAAAILFGFLFMDPTIGLANTTVSATRWLGWAWYVYVESFGSLMVALFWAFMADTTTPESAKKGYFVLAMAGQVGGMIGSWYIAPLGLRFGTSSAPVIILLGFFVFLVVPIVYWFMQAVPKDQLTGYQGKETTKQKHEGEEPGAFDGFRLMLTQPYLFGIFAVITIYEVVVTILDFQFKMLVSNAYASELQRSAYLGDFGGWTNFVALVCLVLGVSNIQKKLGLSASLALLPILVAVAVLTLRFNPILAVAFWIMVLSKAFNYALNQPSIQQLYIPTTKDAKYKAKAFIEMFGSRGSKAMGSGVNILGKYMPLGQFLMVSSIASMGLISVWFFVALYLGRTCTKAIVEKKVVC